ncbi:MAG TPA: cobalt ECF transporter T component CbiQ [Burkholderiaceae bacterium]|nr:cobalt ECF transporter T component CbiQ [Burkholderiaceae bacterium]
MSGVDGALRALATLDALAARPGPAARLDARAKLLVTAAYIVAVVSFERHAVAALVPFAAYPLLLGAWARVPAGPVLCKLAIASPFALMVGAFNPWIDTAPMLQLGSLSISSGWVSYASLLLRFVLTVSAALLLVATTGMREIAAALGALGVPREFTAQLLFLHRYSFVVGEEARRMATAARLRSAGRGLTLGAWSALLGHLLLRAYERARRIHLAMLARGYDGELRPGRPHAWHGRDTAFVLAWLAVFALWRWGEPVAGLGRLLTGGGA